MSDHRCQEGLAVVRIIMHRCILKADKALSGIQHTAVKTAFSFEKGLLSRYEKDGEVLLNSTMQLNFFRVPTDNDGIPDLDWKVRHIADWKKTLIKNFQFWWSDMSVQKEENMVTVTDWGKVLPVSHYLGFDIQILCRIPFPGFVFALAGDEGKEEDFHLSRSDFGIKNAGLPDTYHETAAERIIEYAVCDL